MQASGRRQVSAPLSTRTEAVAVATATGGLPNLTTGATQLNGALAAGFDASVAGGNGGITVDDSAGFIIGDSVIIGYGSGTVDSAVVEAIPNATHIQLVDTDGNDYVLGFDQPDNARVVKDSGPIRPGSVLVNDDGGLGQAVGRDNGAGVIVDISGGGGAPGTAIGTVDYSVGSVVIDTQPSAGAFAGVANYDADTVVDEASITDSSGQGFFKNMQVMTLMRRDAPDAVRVKNLGDEEIGLFVEASVNGSDFANSDGFSVQLKPQGSSVLNMPVGSGNSLVRVRAGSARTVIKSDGTELTVADVGTDIFAPNNNSSLVDVDTFSGIEYNGE